MSVVLQKATNQLSPEGPAVPPRNRWARRAEAFRDKADQLCATASRNLMLLGKADEVEGATASIREAANRVCSVFLELSANASVAAVAAKFSLTEGSVRRWIDGGLPQAMGIWGDWFQKSISSRDIPRHESTDFAYILGVHAGKTEVGSAIQRFEMIGSGREALDYLHQALDALFPGVVIRDTRGWSNGHSAEYVQANSITLAKYLNEVTDFNRRLPWEHLITREERATFLRACFATCSTVGASKYPTIRFTKIDGLSLVEDVAWLLTRFGIAPNIIPGPPPMLEIGGARSVQRFLDQIELENLDDLDRLTGLLASKRWRLEYFHEEYEAVIRGVEVSDEPREVPYPTASRWRRGESPPRDHLRFEDIVRRRIGKPDPECMGYLRRNLGASVEAALEIARCRNLPAARQTRLELARQGIAAVDADVVHLIKPFEGDVVAESSAMPIKEIVELADCWSEVLNPASSIYSRLAGLGDGTNFSELCAKLASLLPKAERNRWNRYVSMMNRAETTLKSRVPSTDSLPLRTTDPVSELDSHPPSPPPHP